MVKIFLMNLTYQKEQNAIMDLSKLEKQYNSLGKFSLNFLKKERKNLEICTRNRLCSYWEPFEGYSDY
jgi:hypothetical protein